MKYWKLPGFEAMRRTWYKRLADVGFHDIEELDGPGRDRWVRPETTVEVDIIAMQEVAAVNACSVEEDCLWTDMPDHARVFWALVAQQGWSVEPAARIAGMGANGHARREAHRLAEEIRRRVLRTSTTISSTG